jgi:hypothetical protein
MAVGWEEVVAVGSWVGTGAGTGVGEADRAAESKEGAGEAAEGKQGAGEAAVVQENCIWLMSRSTVPFNFLKKSMPRMGPVTAACKKLDVKNLPSNWTVFLMKPQEGIGCPSPLLRRGPDGLDFKLQGTMLKVAPVSTKYLSFVNSSVKNIKPALAGKCMAVAVACVELAAEPKLVRRQSSFPTKHRVKRTCEPCWRSSCEIYRCHCQGFETNENPGGKGGDF